MTIADGSLIEMVVNMVELSQQTLNVYQYRINGFPGTPSAVQVAEAYWNNIKGVYRAACSVGLGNVFVSVRIRELNNPSGDYAEFDVPTAEKVGTRATPAGDTLPPNLATGVRLVVGTRATRPGQKRIGFMYEIDQAAGLVTSGWKTLVTNIAAAMTQQLTLGAPAALTGLQPIVCRKDASGFVTANQPITGYIVSDIATTQNSRKIGRGA